ncbi:phosphotransferase [Nocardioides currus]|uniref:Phosphotransferase n=1 Tax=Nocardioides currus TaxID=2133958 RepID=A0A2R7YUG2_9ACTN|nr:phosphotransferase [Nocardioides currus]PUA79971.1 phosphotransferase [Nocardioides currus]
MWQPEPGWQRLPAGASPSVVGVWLATETGREVVVKRLRGPVDGDEPELSDWRSFAWWEREPQVALHGLVAQTPGLRGPVTVRVDQDEEGTTLVQEVVAEVDNPGLFAARALGRFARTPVPEEPWLARGQLRERLARTERRGGWTTLARTTLADVADHLWRQRGRHLDALDTAPQVLQHGDPTPANLRGRAGDEVVAIDWSSLGTGAVGHDLGLWALATREDFEPLLAAYVEGLADPDLAPVAAAGARTTAVYTSLSRLDWALRRVADGEGALAGKYSHPSVAPYVHAMQRQAAQIEALLG